MIVKELKEILADFDDDVIVTASRDVPNGSKEPIEVEWFDITSCVRYNELRLLLYIDPHN